MKRFSVPVPIILRGTLRLATAVALLLAALATPAQALPEAQRGEAFSRLEKKTMCIACNVPLNIAQAAQADAQRTQIRLLLDRGLSEQQVLDRLVVDYGPNILAAPKARGFSALAYVVPAGVLAGLLALGVVLLPRWRRTRADGGDPLSPVRRPASRLSRAENERLDAELARFGV